MNFGTNVLNEPQLISAVQEDYIKYINVYKNAIRPSIFVRYYNINSQASTYDPKNLATHENYHVSDIKFDIYDFTPLLASQPMQNRATDDAAIRGFSFDGTNNISIYTIKEPKLGDLIAFYPPLNKSKEIMKVINLGMSTHLHFNNLPYFELELDYAPIISINDLKINKSYVYNMPQENYMEREDFYEYTKQVERIQQILLEIRKYFNKLKDVYECDQKVPLVTNELIAKLKRNYNSGYNRLFEQVHAPFNYNIIVGPDSYLDLLSMPFVENINNEFLVYNLKNNQLETYTWYQDEDPTNNLEHLLLLSKNLYNELITNNIIDKD